MSFVTNAEPEAPVDADRADFIYLRIAENDRGDVTLILALPGEDACAPLSRRLRQTRRIFLRSLRKFRMIDKGPLADHPWLTFAPGQWEELYEACLKLDSRLAAVWEQPVTGRMVDDMLGLNAQERLRWSKDGRLPPCGYRLSARNENRFNLAVFSIDMIEKLRCEPALIDLWRRQDASHDVASGDRGRNPVMPMT